MTGSIENNVILVYQEGDHHFSHASKLTSFSQLLHQGEAENYGQESSAAIEVMVEPVDQLDAENYLQDILVNTDRDDIAEPVEFNLDVGEIESEILMSHSDANSITLSYPFKLTAHGNLDYLDLKSNLSKGEGNRLISQMPFSAQEEFGIQVGTNNKDHLLNRSVQRKLDRSHQQLFLKLMQEPLKTNTKEELTSPKSINKYTEEPKVSALVAFLSRNISYIRTNDGRTKVVLRDYRSDEVSLALLYNKIRSQLQEHQEVVINGKSQSVNY